MDASRPHSPVTARPRRLLPAALALATALALPAAVAAQRTLIYRFEPGDVREYEQRETVTTLAGDEPQSASTARIQLWCLERTGEEWLLLAALTRTRAGAAEPACGGVLYVDAGGRRRFPEQTATRLGPLEPVLDLLPVLPTAIQREREWYSAPDLYGRRWHCTVRGPDAEHAGHLRIDYAVDEGAGIAALLDRTIAGRFWFDQAAGGITRVESEQLDRRRQTRTTSTAQLVQQRRERAAWAGRRAAEVQRFLRAQRHEDRLLHEIVTRPAEFERTLAGLDRLWSAFRSDVAGHEGSPLALLAEARRAALRALAPALRARSALGRRWMEQPALPWSLQDAAGATLTSEEVRQGVVIEFFWSADSEWALRALDPLRQLQAALRTERAQLLCYNLDRDLERAQRAIAACGGGLRHVLGGPLREVEHFPELPVVRVLDADGRVRDVWLGWAPDYAAVREAARNLAP